MVTGLTGITLFGPWFEQTIKREKRTKTFLSPEDFPNLVMI